ncbi:MAG TPA: aminopeptidase, partial [Candidatus Ozemobacteraceae bacterium]|nr:aminopeptidase [Candidatus Ozemobacteraceae bacterium]
MNETIRRGCEALVRMCGNVRWGEAALVVTDPTTRELGNCLMEVLAAATNRAELVVIPRARIHGQEPPDDVAAKMRAADVVFGLPCMSMAHTQARLAASVAGTRYLSLPDYDFEQVASPALQTDFRALTGLADRIARLFTRGLQARISSAAGTRLDLDISGRIGNAAPGWCAERGALASPPDAESNVAPVEGTAEGILVIDGSIPCADLGLLREPLTLTIRAGRIVGILGPQAAILADVLD